MDHLSGMQFEAVDLLLLDEFPELVCAGLQPSREPDKNYQVEIDGLPFLDSTVREPL